MIQALSTYADVVCRPRLPEEGFQAARDLSLQSLAGIEDEPRQKLVIALREFFFPSPLGRNPMGNKEDLEKLTLELCSAQSRRYCGNGAILAVAGAIDFDQVKGEVEKLLGDFNGRVPQMAVLISPNPARNFSTRPASRLTLASPTRPFPRPIPTITSSASRWRFSAAA